MIFVTVGTQLPFDRLIKAVDELPFPKDIPVVAQVGKTTYQVKKMIALEFMSPKDFDLNFAKAKLIISHAGTGNILSALVQNKPIIIMPRLAKFSEHRNDHQLATAKQFEKLNYVYTAYNEIELQEKIKFLLNTELMPLHYIGNFASQNLLQSIRSEIDRVAKIKSNHVQLLTNTNSFF